VKMMTTTMMQVMNDHKFWDVHGYLFCVSMCVCVHRCFGDGTKLATEGNK
jgi:hypothetical protein